MTTHADKLAEALDAARMYVAMTAGQSVLLLQIDKALTEYRARPQLPGAELVWELYEALRKHHDWAMDHDDGNYTSPACAAYQETVSALLKFAETHQLPVHHDVGNGKQFAQADHNAILSAISGGAGEVKKLQGMLKRATMAYCAHAPVKKQDGDIAKAVFDEIDAYLNSLIPAPPVLGGEVGE